MGVIAQESDDLSSIGMRLISEKIDGLPAAKYLAESTITGSSDLEKEAEGHLRAGYPTHGVRISLEAPVKWEGYVGKSRNIRYKVQSLLATDGILRADNVNRDNRWYKPALKYIRDWVSNYIVRVKKTISCGMIWLLVKGTSYHTSSGEP